MGQGMPRVITTERDLSFYVDSVVKGRSCVAGITQKGPVGKAVFIGSGTQFERMFGREYKESDFPTVVRRALAYGAALYVSRVVPVKEEDQPKTASVAISNEDDSEELLRISASSPGAWGNRLSVEIVHGDIAEEGFFALRVYDGDHTVETMSNVSMDEASESYVGNGKPEYVTIEDISETATLPKEGKFVLTGGSDGGDITDADYIAALSAFDELDDALQVAVPCVTSPVVITAGLAYAERRRDMVFITEVPPDSAPQDALDFRMGKGTYTHAPFVSTYGAMYYPKVRIYDTLRQRERPVSVIGDVLGVIAASDFAENEAFVPAGARRGKIINALGVDINVGSPGMKAQADLLCENQINPICVYPDTGTVIWSASTLSRSPSLLNQLNIRRLMIVVEKTVTAYARYFIHQPNDPATWREFYRGIDPRFRDWVAQRWMYDYRIVCDQDARSLDDAKLNLPETVAKGEFKCHLFIKPMTGIRWLLIDANVTRLDARFEESVVDSAYIAA